MIMMMMIVLIMICSRPPLYGYHADTSLSRTVFFVPGESPYDFLQIQPALCGHLLMWTTQWTLVSCQINRFSWNVNLANADSSFSPCAVINLSLFKIKKKSSFESISMFPALQYTKQDESWTSISDYFASKELCGERF